MQNSEPNLEPKDQKYCDRHDEVFEKSCEGCEADHADWLQDCYVDQQIEHPDVEYNPPEAW